MELQRIFNFHKSRTHTYTHSLSAKGVADNAQMYGIQLYFYSQSLAHTQSAPGNP